MFRGIITALVTPFENGRVDFQSFGRLIDRQIAEGIDGFVVNGTTGESPTVTPAEKIELLRFAKAQTKDRVPIIAGVGSNSTEATLANARAAEEAGADAHLVVVPYYNKPPRRGLLAHFQKIASETNRPNILYNVPSRTVAALDAETVQELSEHSNIIGIKEASGDLALARDLRKRCRKDFLLLSGDDFTFEEFMEAGGDGVISVTSHVLLRAMQARKLHEYSDLCQLLFCEANPIPVKMALTLQGILQSAELRLPLVTFDSEKTKALNLAMKKAGLLGDPA